MMKLYLYDDGVDHRAMLYNDVPHLVNRFKILLFTRFLDNEFQAIISMFSIICSQYTAKKIHFSIGDLYFVIVRVVICVPNAPGRHQKV